MSAPSLLRLAPDEAERAHAIVAACGRDMLERLGFDHWWPPRSLEHMRTDARDRELWLLLDGDGAAIATFTVGGTQLPSYPPLWDPSVERALYLNRLAVLPSAQRRGIGRFCMERVEARARERGDGAVRFDALAKHEKLLGFYRALGYRERGHADNCGLDVVCFEKIL